MHQKSMHQKSLRSVFATVALLAAAFIVPGASAAGLDVDVEAPFLTTQLFAFHSDPEINLHHFLFRWATVAPPPGGEPARPTELELWPGDRERLAELSDAERADWTAALVFYRDRLRGRSLLFDRQLVAVRDALAGKGAREAVTEAADREVFAHLDRCLPVYRRHWWPGHDRGNREWVASITPLLLRHELAIAGRIAAAYEAGWPSPPNRVDVAAYSNRVSAYTTSEPHATISSADPKLAMPWAFEMVFHEHSHADALEQPLTEIVDAAFAGHGKRAPRNLWHILLFATAGESVRLERVAAGDPDYVPYAQHEGVFTRADIDRAAWQSVAKHWRPALAEGRPLSAVIDAIAADLLPLLD